MPARLVRIQAPLRPAATPAPAALRPAAPPAPSPLRRATALALALALAAGLVAAMLAPAVARADGDPASDVLLGANVFFPYTPPVATGIQKTLNVETAAASHAKFPIKVALIASPVDLGVIPDLFGKPQKYADFLDQEISFQTRQPLLVVMSAGYGVQGIHGPARLAVATLPRPAGGTTNDLARAAITAVAKLASASGHPIRGVAGIPQGPSSGGSSTTPIVIALAAAAVLTAAVLVALRRRQTAT
jgi:hypothetical protein